MVLAVNGRWRRLFGLARFLLNWGYLEKSG